MADISTAILDIKSVLQSVIKPTGSTKGFSRIFNNQFRYMEEGAIETFPFPCTFIEVQMPEDHAQLGGGITDSTVTFKIHIGSVEYDAQDGTLEENKTIFAYRDDVVAALTHYQPTGCGRLMKIREQQDYEHTNVYHYIIEFQCAFIDTTGAEAEFFKEGPTDLGVIVTKVNFIV